MVLIGQGGCIREKWLCSGKSGFIWAKFFYSGKSGCNRAKVDLFGQ